MPNEAIYRFATLASHPWSVLPERRFTHRVVADPGRRDTELERICASEASTLVIFGGWRDRTILPALVKRERTGFPFAFWTDTPRIDGGLARRALNAAQLFFVRRSVAMLATGSPAIENYVAMGVPPRMLRNFPYIVDPVHFRRREDRNAADGSAATFLLPARLIDKLKGQRVAIDALAIARRRLPEAGIRLILAGVGPDEKELRDHAAEAGVAETVEFRGWVEYENMPALFKRSVALLLPSHWEPYGIVVIEAMAAGKPVLGSAACGTVRERVKHGENGFVHQPGDSAALAEHMCTVASSADVRNRLGAEAFKTSDKWGIEMCANAIRELLAELES